MSRPELLLGPLEGLSADQINARFSQLIAAEEWGTLTLPDGVFADLETAVYSNEPMFTFVDILCGAGGSSLGLALAGGRLLKAVNHSARVIETHQANFRSADHEVADLDHYDMRNLPDADVLWASVICTESSPAGGKKRKRKDGTRPEQEALLKFGPVTKDVFERTRATALDVIKAVEARRFPYVIVENVVEFVTDWELVGWWLDGMTTHLGYEVQLLCVSAAHVGDVDNPHAAQRRDRIYYVFNRKGTVKPDLKFTPLARCETCGDVEAYQWWKRPDGRMTASGRMHVVGKYGVKTGQYVYRCPNRACYHCVVTPYERPAAEIINWGDLGVPIEDRRQHGLQPLRPTTLRRIARGIRMFGRPTIVNSGHDDDRVYPPEERPLPAATQKIGFGLATPQPFLDANGGSWNQGFASVHNPLRARTASEWEALCVPPEVNTAFYVKNYGDGGRPEDRVRPVTQPFGAMTTGRNHSLVVPVGAFVSTARQHVVPTPVAAPITAVAAGGNHHELVAPRGLVVPYSRTGVARPADYPMGAVTTRDGFGLATDDDGNIPEDVMRARYRMLSWREQARAQRFPNCYTITGNDGERTAQAGNAVAVNVSRAVGMRVRDALHATKAAAR